MFRNNIINDETRSEAQLKSKSKLVENNHSMLMNGSRLMFSNTFSTTGKTSERSMRLMIRGQVTQIDRQPVSFDIADRQFDIVSCMY
jgi:hypothetical protein